LGVGQAHPPYPFAQEVIMSGAVLIGTGALGLLLLIGVAAMPAEAVEEQAV
jgi:hypothetical protein